MKNQIEINAGSGNSTVDVGGVSSKEKYANSKAEILENIFSSANLPKVMAFLEVDLLKDSNYAVHEKFGSALPDTELRNKVREFYSYRESLAAEVSKRYSLACKASLEGDLEPMREFRAFEKDKERNPDERAVQLKIIPDCEGFARICDWKSGFLCFDYTFLILRREGSNYRSPMFEGFLSAMQDMGYEPVDPHKPQEFDVVMYYTLGDDKISVKPTHWGMIKDEQVISKNYSDSYVYRHDLSALPEDFYMLFRKIDPAKQNPGSITVALDSVNYMEHRGAMVPVKYIHPVREFIKEKVRSIFKKEA